MSTQPKKIRPVATPCQSYRESFGLKLPPAATDVSIEFLDGCDYSIIWNNCPDGENVLYSWIKKRSAAEAIVTQHQWNLT